MDLATYKRHREELLNHEPRRRFRCLKCLQPDVGCYCPWLQPFDPNIRFVILTHPLECRRRVATGRMSHLSLKNSRLIRGYDYSLNAEVNELLSDSSAHNLLLFPGEKSKNISEMTNGDLSRLVPNGKKLTIWVIDGTWWTARKMISMSRNLFPMDRICFTPSKPSEFRVRRQPRVECYSTIEAIHQTIDLLGPACGFVSREHDGLLVSFRRMVDKQIELQSTRPNSHRIKRTPCANGESMPAPPSSQP